MVIKSGMEHFRPEALCPLYSASWLSPGCSAARELLAARYPELVPAVPGDFAGRLRRCLGRVRVTVHLHFISGGNEDVQGASPGSGERK